MARGRGRLRKSLTLSGLVPLAEEDFTPACQNALAQDRTAVHPLVAHGDIAAHRDRHLGRARHTHASDRPALIVPAQRRGVLHVFDFGHLEQVAAIDHAISIAQSGLTASFFFVFF